MLKSLRRASTQPDQTDTTSSDAGPARRTSTAPNETSRRPSLATISRRLGRSRKSHANTIKESNDDSNQLGQLLTSLPHDIHALIFSLLPPSDILALRLTSTVINSLLNDCAPTITTSALCFALAPHDVPHVLRLYPQPRSNYSLTHFLTLLRRHHTILSTTTMLNNFIQHKIYMLRPHRSQAGESDQTQTRLSSITTTALWHIAHLLEHHRDLLLSTHPTSHSSTSDPSAHPSRFWPCQSCTSTLSGIINSYPQHLLLPIYHIHHLLTLHLRSSSRAPSYTGTIERALRGWSRKPPGDEQLAMVVLLGGLEELRKLTVLKGTYNNRLEILKTFLIKIEDAVEARKARDAARETQTRNPRPRPGKMVVGPRGIERVELAASSSTLASTDSGLGLTAPAPAAIVPLPTQPEAEAPPRDLTTSHLTAFADVTDDTLAQIPPLEDICLLPLRRRIESEVIDIPHPDSDTPATLLLDLLPEDDRDEEFETPYRWVSRVVNSIGGYYGNGGASMASPAASGGEEDGATQGEAGGADPVPANGGQVNGALAGNAAGSVNGAAHAPQQQQQQQQLPPGINSRGRMSSQGAFTFSGFSRSIIVSVGRGD